MRNVVIAVILALISGFAHAGQGCLHVMGDVNGVFCPKCSNPGASARIASKKIGAGMCLSCQFYCWFTATPEGGEYTFLSMAAVDEAECQPDNAERKRVLDQAIPLALHMERADFERVAAKDPAAAATLASMLWRGDESTMTDARLFMAQYKFVPSYANALALFDAYDETIAMPFGAPLAGLDFLHVEVKGERFGDDGARLTLQTSLDASGRREPTHAPLVINVRLTRDEVAASFAGAMVVARHAWATFP